MLIAYLITIALGIAYLMLRITIRHEEKYTEFVRKSKDITAKIKYIDVIGRGDNRLYIITIEYSVESVRYVEEIRRYNWNTYKYNEGDNVQIRYFIDDPRQVEIQV